MREVIKNIAEKLEMIKGFSTGYTSRVDNRMVVDFGDDRYILTLEKLEHKDKDMFKDIDMYLQ